jgi:hypothetical protein
MLAELVGSKLRAKILGWLFTHPDERYFVRQLQGLIEQDSTNISRELARLEALGIQSDRGQLLTPDICAFGSCGLSAGP